ncbi:MAG: 50S ribosomal protein L35 [Candidatus Nanopelagicales bacterium]|jgi:large subunit ribosomal protein L35|nr:50S ribosomal protein L35 [Candidatus Nanopelagicales bacterium]
MPKMKTHSGTKKRVKVTGSGKLMHEQINKRHRLEVKTSKRSRKLQQDSAVSAGDSKNVKRLLGMR